MFFVLDLDHLFQSMFLWQQKAFKKREDSWSRALALLGFDGKTVDLVHFLAIVYHHLRIFKKYVGTCPINR